MRVRLRTLSSKDKPPRVDRSGAGSIMGVSIITEGTALGHGFDIDAITLAQVVELGSKVPGRWTHGDLCADGLGTHLGRWSNLRREGNRVVGDFAFSASAKNVQPAGLSVAAPTYLMDLAEEDPTALGVSAVLELDKFEEVAGEDGETRKLARVKKVSRADYVADPAANPDGLFAETPSAFAEAAGAALSQASTFHGRERVAGFLRAWLKESPEDRVTLEALTAKHAEELAARDALLAEFKAELAAMKAAEIERLDAEDKAYVESLRAQSAAAQAPIDAAKIAKVEAHLAAGRREIAREFGAELLEAALARGQKPAGTKSAAPPAANTHQIAVVKGEAELLRSQGYTVQLSPDGTQILSATKAKE